MHLAIPPFAALVRREHLTDGAGGHGEYLPCTVFALSSYAGHAPTFQVLVEDRFLYSYLPPHALAAHPCEALPLEECAFTDCPDEEARIDAHPHLVAVGRCAVYRRDRAFWTHGRYLWTVEWTRCDHALHLVALDGGPYVLWPNHRLAFGDGAPGLPSFRRSTREWRIGDPA